MLNRKILIRFDDICPTMDWHQWDKAKSMLDSVGAVALLGVIPDCKDPDLMIDTPREDFWEYIKNLQCKGYTIAMHGCYHVFDIRSKGLVTPKKQSEFAGHSYEVQYQRIKYGKSILSDHGIDTDVFFAPAHSYDRNTLRALSACGFRYISDGKSQKPYQLDGIICLPCRNSGAAKIGNKEYYTSVFHAHEWTWENKRRDYQAFENTIISYSQDIVSFEEYSSQPMGSQPIERMKEKCFAEYQNRVRPILSLMYHIVADRTR